MTDTFVVDQWSGLDHKLGMDPEEAGELNQAPKYVKVTEDIRRINAYKRLLAMIETVGRGFLREDPADPDRVLNWREYGDPAVFVDRVAAGVLGDEPGVLIVGADDPVPDRPEWPDPPDAPVEVEPVDGETDTDRQLREIQFQIESEVFEQRVAAWEADLRQELTSWSERSERAPRLKARQEWLQEWADDEDLIAKLTEMEQEFVVGLGSGVATMGWNARKRRPEVKIHSPEWYFPDLTDEAGEFPATVHLCWPFMRTVPGSDEPVAHVKRKTWQLLPLEEIGAVAAPAYLAAGEVQTHGCVYTEAVFLAEDFEDVYDLEAPGAEFEQIPDPADPTGATLIDADRVYIGLDFCPVVHVSNTLNRSGSHFGRSILIRLVQLFDQIAATDMDIALASAQAARPPVFASGLPAGQDVLEMNPGTAVALREGGAIGVVDMAENLATLIDAQKENHLRASVNGQIPQGLLGRIDAKDVPSGIAYVLSFTPFEQLIKRLRKTRDTAYSRLLLKFAQRIAIANGADHPSFAVAESYPAEVRFGSFMPQDLVGVANAILILRQAKVLAQETGAKMAQAAGAPSGNLDDEMASIRSEMGDVANDIADATGSVQAALWFLGIDPDDLDDVEIGGGGGLDDGGPVLPVPAGAGVLAGV